MVLKITVFTICTILLQANAKPEPPYYYPAPFASLSPTFNTQHPGIPTPPQNIAQPSPISQNYLPTNYNTVQPTPISQNYLPTNYNTVQQNYVIPSTSYGTPFLRNTANAGTAGVTSSISAGLGQQDYTGGFSPSRNYGSPDLISSHQAPSNAFISQSGPINVQKHIYVHVAPPDEEERRQSIQQQQLARQKHYKIIFIKTPTYSPTRAQIIAQQAQQQEKTLVYVLVKKPDDELPVPAAQVAPAPINKPEVYFIRYKAKNDQQNLGVQQVVQQVENLQENTDSVVVESAGSKAAGGLNRGYNYERPTGAQS